MKNCFQKIKEEAMSKGLNRFPTSIAGVQTLDDMKWMLEKLNETVLELDSRLAEVEEKIIL